MYGIPGLDRALLPAAVLRRTAAAVPGITLISGTTWQILQSVHSFFQCFLCIVTVCLGCIRICQHSTGRIECCLHPLPAVLGIE